MTDGGAPAGFASRLTAFVTDAVVFGISHALISWTTAQILTLLVNPRFAERLGPWVVAVSGSVLAIAYFVVSWSAFGRTPGKALLGLAVTTPGGGRPGVLRSLLRLLGYTLSAIPLGAGFLWVLVDDDRRGWHDYLAGTFVVYRTGPRTRTRALATMPGGSD